MKNLERIKNMNIDEMANLQQKTDLIEIMEEMFELLNKTIPIIKKNKPNLYERCLLKNIGTEFEELRKKLELLNVSFE